MNHALNELHENLTHSRTPCRNVEDKKEVGVSRIGRKTWTNCDSFCENERNGLINIIKAKMDKTNSDNVGGQTVR